MTMTGLLTAMTTKYQRSLARKNYRLIIDHSRTKDEKTTSESQEHLDYPLQNPETALDH